MNYLMVTHILKSTCGAPHSGHLCSCFAVWTHEGTGQFWFLYELSVAFITSIQSGGRGRGCACVSSALVQSWWFHHWTMEGGTVGSDLTSFFCNRASQSQCAKKPGKLVKSAYFCSSILEVKLGGESWTLHFSWVPQVTQHRWPLDTILKNADLLDETGLKQVGGGNVMIRGQLGLTLLS